MREEGADPSATGPASHTETTEQAEAAAPVETAEQTPAADETPAVPGDAQPEDLDVAIAVDRFMKATNVDVNRVSHSWAGLRTFAPDRTFVVGFDSRAKGFFWLAGQGGYGVQSAPGVSEYVRHLVTGDSLDADYGEVLDFADAVSPERLIEGKG